MAIDGVFGSAGKPDQPPVKKMIKTSGFLESLGVPALRKNNMTQIWRNTITAEELIDDKGPARPLIEMAEAGHASKLSVTSLKMQGMDGTETPVHILFDGERKKGLIVTDEVSDDTRHKLSYAYVVVSYADTSARDAVQNFIAESCKVSSRKGDARAYEEYLTKAFSLRAAHENNLEP